MVYVLNKNNRPLMPCSNVIARLMLKEGKAKCSRRTPFTIKLRYDSTGYTQDLTLGIDTGSKYVGSAVTNANEEVVYLSQIEIRNNITEKMKQRSGYRRNRRNRKTRYRKPRWLNRANSTRKDRFSPTMTSKIDSHLKEISFVKSILPITKVIIETATFDPHALKNPNILQDKTLYQKGPNYGFANTKAFVLNRDSYTCQKCKKKSKGTRLEVHHIVYKKNGGSDVPENLVCLCKTCHEKIHSGTISLKKSGKIKGQLKHATQMNSIRTQLLKRVECEETFGYITKENRQMLGLPKEHYYDAVAIASRGNPVTFKTKNVLFKKCVSSGDYQRSKGVRSQIKIPAGKIKGFRKFDKVRYLGKEYFIKGRHSTGYCDLMDITGKAIDFSNEPYGMKTPKMQNMKRIASRKTWIFEIKNWNIENIPLNLKVNNK